VSTDGINEKGLNANLLYLDDTEYETRDRRPGVPYNLWAQYLLDNFSTVDEALKAMNEVQIVPLKILGHQWPIHISLADRAGDTAIVEFVQGKMFVYRGARSAVMTNEPSLPEQLANLQNYRPFGGARPVPGDFDPVSRFVRLSAELQGAPRPRPTSQAKMTMMRMIGSVTVPMNANFIKGLPTFKDWILQYVSVEEWPTIWVSLADLAHGAYSVRSTRNGNSLWLDLNGIDFSEGREVMDVNMDDNNASGDATRFLRPAKPPFTP
jgi:choloylglycine hydrolase